MARKKTVQPPTQQTTSNTKSSKELLPLPTPNDIREFLMRVVRSNPTNPRASLTQVLDNLGEEVLGSPLFNLCLSLCRKDPDNAPDWAVLLLVGSHDVMAAKAWSELGKNVASDTEATTEEGSTEHEKGIVWADQFAKINVKNVLDACKSAGIWNFPDDTLWIDWTKQDKNGHDVLVSDPLQVIKHVDEIDVLTSLNPAVIQRLETEHRHYTGKPMGWTVCHALTAAVNPRVFWMPDPAGGAIFFAETEPPKGTDPGLAIGVFPLQRGEWERFAIATNFTENTAWKSPDFVQSNSHPVVSVSYLDAQKYLEWVNTVCPPGRTIGIPKEPEWLHAATRGDGRTYPWGEQDPSGPIGEELLQWSGYESKQGTSSVFAHWRGHSPFGIHDMAGNTWEWTSTVHES